MLGAPAPIAITDEHIELFNAHRADAENIVPREGMGPFSEWTLTSVTSQVVNGTNFEFLMNCGDGITGGMSVFRPLPHTGEPTKMISFSYSMNNQE